MRVDSGLPELSFLSAVNWRPSAKARCFAVSCRSRASRLRSLDAASACFISITPESASAMRSNEFVRWPNSSPLESSMRALRSPCVHADAACSAALIRRTSNGTSVITEQKLIKKTNRPIVLHDTSLFRISDSTGESTYTPSVSVASELAAGHLKGSCSGLPAAP